MRLRIATAGWSIPSALAARFPGTGSHLERYARVLSGVEIDTSFYRPHRISTYERWAASTPSSFRFSVKLPREITHERRLEGAGQALEAFLEQVAGLGNRLGTLLMQLPPSLGFEEERVGHFFEQLRGLYAGPVACEPRESGWFSSDAAALLKRFHVARVAADPAVVPEADRPGGWQGPAHGGRGALRYYRWHGSPRKYWSRYDADWLTKQANELARLRGGGECWCVFDNTASGAALDNALALVDLSAREGAGSA